MNGRKVGRLTRTSSGKLQFSYFEEWLSWELSRPLSLSMPLTQEPYAGEIVKNYFDAIRNGERSGFPHFHRRGAGKDRLAVAG
jgi:HipA-like protein